MPGTGKLLWKTLTFGCSLLHLSVGQETSQESLHAQYPEGTGHTLGIDPGHDAILMAWGEQSAPRCQGSRMCLFPWGWHPCSSWGAHCVLWSCSCLGTELGAPPGPARWLQLMERGLFHFLLSFSISR